MGGSTSSEPFRKECFDDVRGAAPIVSLLAGATIHYAIVFTFIYWKNGDTMCGLISGVFKMLWAAIIFICAWISLILDYIVAARYNAFKNPWNFGDRWQRYNCQIYLFSANPNMIHV